MTMPSAAPELPFSARLLSGWSRDIAVAGAFLTRLPLRPRGADASSTLARAARAFPLIGLGVGMIAAGGLSLAAGLGLHPIGCALIGLALAAAVTGALHEDGLADVADGFGGGGASAIGGAVREGQRARPVREASAGKAALHDGYTAGLP